RPVELAQGPLLRTTLFKLAPQEHVLLLVIHHIIFDGRSVGVFFHELATLYQALVSGQPTDLPDLPIQYVDFTIWQREWLQGEKLAEQLAYWKEQLAGAPAVLELPTDRPRTPTPTNIGSKYLFRFSKR